ncbi:Blood group Rhesus C/E and D polypeptide:Sugar transporter superfamily:Major facilitator superfamily (MFS) [Fulvimarina pelagi HTCC2506]|uniref:Blood group Rhesus C/E and D polypeptide:Sugar transporter superfamily:Major facilitator superfamily (MFS) n=1 Tax=Fulvimarina pelagi HTCC2506 TaxID=314231 RepID=Q0G4B9_9HYPH|nr:Blood group Rhesus C/E and D polypeptide:Sugar transporter superfamily:Major facilitator superfamily (MFS) [Fulvimarina pelagi HTCC2506]
MSDEISDDLGAKPGAGSARTPDDDRFAAFRNDRFLRYWLARFLSAFAIQVVIVAVGWQVYDLTRDPWDLGLIGLCQFMPALLLVLVTGAVADRYSRRGIMGAMTILEGASVVALMIFTWEGLVSPGPIFVILVVLGIARAFFGPASQALVVNLVTRDELANAIAWNSSSWQIASITGPVAGGLLYGLSPLVAYGTGATLFFLASVLVLSIRAPAQRLPTEPASMETIIAGFRFIWHEKVVLGAISLDLFAVLLGGAVALMPVYARDVLDVGPWGLGLLRAAPGIGAVTVALWLAAHPIKDNAGAIMFAFVAAFGAFTALFGLSTVPWLSIVALALMGASDMISVYVRETLMQLWTPDDVRGRVNAVNMVFIGASNELGEFRAGTMATFIGAVPAVVLGGFATVGVAGLWAWMFPDLRKAKHLAARN